ncbi:hypothetical protein SLA2020_490160 [Shorea laevis]
MEPGSKQVNVIPPSISRISLFRLLFKSLFSFCLKKMVRSIIVKGGVSRERVVVKDSTSADFAKRERVETKGTLSRRFARGCSLSLGRLVSRRSKKATSGSNRCFGHSVDSLLPVRACCHAGKSRGFGRFYLLLDLNQ